MGKVNLNAIFGPRGAIRAPSVPGRNDPCPCGATEKRPDLVSFDGKCPVRRKKYKRCCMKGAAGE